LNEGDRFLVEAVPVFENAIVRIRRGGLRPPAIPDAPTTGGRRPFLQETIRLSVGADSIRPHDTCQVNAGG